MRSILGLLKVAPSQGERDTYIQKFLDYKKWVEQVQTMQSRGGLGEPQYYLDGRPYLEGVARPQVHGPALRVRVLTEFGQYLTQIEGSPWGLGDLYKDKQGRPGVLKKDLDYLLRHSLEESFDLWGEVKGSHFYSKKLTVSALREGAKLAVTLEDSDQAQAYSKKAAELEKSLASHWDEGWKIIRSSLDDEKSKRWSGLDSSVVLAYLYTDSSVLDAKLWATMDEMERVFQDLYWVNSGRTQEEKMGPGIGRYPEDSYYGGNPWFLTTLAFAECYYKAAYELAQLEQLEMDEFTRAMVGRLLLGQIEAPLPEGVLPKDHPYFQLLLQEFLRRAENTMKRVQFHGGPRGRLSEQFHRDTGLALSARDLTWSYAGFLSTVLARKKVLGGGVVRRD